MKEVNDLLRRLLETGYRVTLEGEELHLKFWGTTEPDPQIILPLFDEIRQYKSKLIDYLKLIKTDLRAIKKPIRIESEFLNDFFYLVRDEEMAATVEAKGEVAYTADEVNILINKFSTMGIQDFNEHMRAVHRTKKTFNQSKVVG